MSNWRRGVLAERKSRILSIVALRRLEEGFQYTLQDIEENGSGTRMRRSQAQRSHRPISHASRSETTISAPPIMSKAGSQSTGPPLQASQDGASLLPQPTSSGEGKGGGATPGAFLV